MKKSRMLMLLAVVGLIGCRGGHPGNKNNTNKNKGVIKTDTALIVGFDFTHNKDKRAMFYSFQDGREYTETPSPKSSVMGNDTLGAYSDCGDMVIAATYRDGRIAVIRNLTQEAQAKALANQR